jgi:hypothetical protein
MLKPVAVALLAALPLLASSAHADTTTTEADTLVVVTPNAPVIVQQGGPGAQPVGGPSAQPAPAPAPVAASAAPQNEDWRDVSHINGVPVKVGERNQYLYKFKKNNISANPFGLFFGYYDASFSHALGQNLAASIAITGWNFDGYSQGYQIAASLPLYFRRTFQGPYLEGGLMVRTDTSDDYYEAYGYGDCYDCMTYDSSNSWVGPELLFGYHWTFDSGFNIQAAVGVVKRLGNGTHDADANGYFRVGYAF